MSDPKQTEVQASAATPKPRRGFRVLLGVSLALNLLFVGAVMGALINGPRGQSGPPSARSIAQPYVAAFDKESKRAMRKDLRGRLGGRKAAIAADNADFAEFVALSRASDFDAARANALMSAQLERVGQVQQVGREVAIERLEAMSFKERTAYADRLEELIQRRGERKVRKER